MAVRWKSYEEQLRDEADSTRGMSPDERIRALSELLDFVLRMLTDTGTLSEKMRLYEQVEEEGHRRWRDWVRRYRA